MSVFLYLELVILLEEKRKKKKTAKRIILPKPLPNIKCFAWVGGKEKIKKKKKKNPVFLISAKYLDVWATLQIIVHSMHACQPDPGWFYPSF